VRPEKQPFIPGRMPLSILTEGCTRFRVGSKAYSHPLLSQVVALGEGVLKARFGERARFIAASVRGMSDEPVQVRIQISLCAAHSQY